MTALFDYPRSAAFGRVVPKARIYEHAGADTALRDLFVEQVDQIVWRYKLAPETLNLSATRAVTEIQVFEIALRTGTLDVGVLRAIDRAIPFPLIFELTHAGRRRAIAAFKRPSEADSTKWVVSDYFAADWVPEDAPREPLPVALDLGVLYDRILTATMPAPAHAGENIRERVERTEAIRRRDGNGHRQDVLLHQDHLRDEQAVRLVEVHHHGPERRDPRGRVQIPADHCRSSC